MRLASFHIDGFGALSDFGVEEVSPGLVVLLGPNEAGKSTLFDFLTGVLFGFPSRRDNPRFRAPVRGGRHGGRVGLLDDSGGRWVVERYGGTQRSLAVRRPDGSSGDEEALARALAGASASLFRAVFAVGLEDLGRMGQLESDEVRELLFAASILGQRRSATAAMRHLAELRDELARPRREDATANRLAAELERLRAELAGARQEAARYGALRRQAEALDGELADLRLALGKRRDREREVQLLRSSWPHHHRAQAARAELARLPAPGPGLQLLAHRAEVSDLARERSGHLERLDRLAKERRSREAIGEGIARRLGRLGEGWTAERARDLTDPGVLARAAQAARDRIGTLRTEVASAEAVLSQAQALQADRRKRVGDPLPGTGGGPAEPAGGVPYRADLERRDTLLAELRERFEEGEQLALETLADERARPQPAPLPGHHRVARQVCLVLVGAATVVGGLAGALALRGQSLAAAAAALVCILLLACGLALWLTERGRGAPGRAGGDADASEGSDPARLRVEMRQALLERSRARVTELAEELGLSAPVSRVDLGRCASATQGEWERRRLLDERAQALAEANDHVATAEREVGKRRRALAAAEEEHAGWCAAHGLSSRSPEETLEELALLGDLREQLAALGRVEAAIATLEPPVTSFTRRYAGLLAAVRPQLAHLAGGGLAAGGLDALPEGLGPTGAHPADPGALEGVLAGLASLLEEAAAREARRRALEAEEAADEEALATTLGGAAGGRLRTELASGEVLAWASEQAELERDIEQLAQLEEEKVRQHQSLAEDMRRLATSDRIAGLERRQDALEVELDAALGRYLVLGTARALLQRTLTRHERERQPAVVASAGRRFERVTGGAYVGLVAGGGGEGRQELRVISAAGQEIDATQLSRGTVEQLYLCLRLGLADSFAERSVSLPVVLDDVLVNFDPERARAVAGELALSARSRQILFLTCHPHLAALMLQASGGAGTEPQLIQLGRIGQPPGKTTQLALAALAALPEVGGEVGARSGADLGEAARPEGEAAQAAG